MKQAGKRTEKSLHLEILQLLEHSRPIEINGFIESNFEYISKIDLELAQYADSSCCQFAPACKVLSCIFLRLARLNLHIRLSSAEAIFSTLAKQQTRR